MHSSSQIYQPMVDWWFGLVVGVAGIPLSKGLLFRGTRFESQTTNLNHQLTTSWIYDGKKTSWSTNVVCNWNSDQGMGGCHIIEKKHHGCNMHSRHCMPRKKPSRLIITKSQVTQPFPNHLGRELFIIGSEKNLTKPLTISMSFMLFTMSFVQYHTFNSWLWQLLYISPKQVYFGHFMTRDPVRSSYTLNYFWNTESEASTQHSLPKKSNGSSSNPQIFQGHGDIYIYIIYKNINNIYTYFKTSYIVLSL